VLSVESLLGVATTRMAVHIPALQPSQVENLGAVRSLGAAQLQAITEKLVSLTPPPLRPDDLTRALNDALPSQEQEVNQIVRLLVSLYALQRQSRLSPDEVWDGLSEGLKALPPDTCWGEDAMETWRQLKPEMVSLLSIENVAFVIKVLDLEYDYQNLLRQVRILADIRPAFDSDVSALRGAIVKFTLRLLYDSPDTGLESSLELSLDQRDLLILKEECERALKKAAVAEKHIGDTGIQSFISGKERDG